MNFRAVLDTLQSWSGFHHHDDVARTEVTLRLLAPFDGGLMNGTVTLNFYGDQKDRFDLTREYVLQLVPAETAVEPA